MQWHCETPDSAQPSLYKPLPITCGWTTVIMIELSFLEKNLPMLSPGPSPTRLTFPLPSLSIWQHISCPVFIFISTWTPWSIALSRVLCHLEPHPWPLPSTTSNPSLLVFAATGENPNWVLRAFIYKDNKSLAQLGSQSPQGFYLLLVSIPWPKEQDTWGSTNGKSPLTHNSILLDLHSLIEGLVYWICSPYWHW